MNIEEQIKIAETFLDYLRFAKSQEQKQNRPEQDELKRERLECWAIKCNSDEYAYCDDPKEVEMYAKELKKTPVKLVEPPTEEEVLKLVNKNMKLKQHPDAILMLFKMLGMLREDS